jgi:hypothetical protein
LSAARKELRVELRALHVERGHRGVHEPERLAVDVDVGQGHAAIGEGVDLGASRQVGFRHRVETSLHVDDVDAPDGRPVHEDPRLGLDPDGIEGSPLPRHRERRLLEGDPRADSVGLQLERAGLTHLLQCNVAPDLSSREPEPRAVGVSVLRIARRRVVPTDTRSFDREIGANRRARSRDPLAERALHDLDAPVDPDAVEDEIPLHTRPRDPKLGCAHLAERELSFDDDVLDPERAGQLEIVEHEIARDDEVLQRQRGELGGPDRARERRRIDPARLVRAEVRLRELGRSARAGDGDAAGLEHAGRKLLCLSPRAQADDGEHDHEPRDQPHAGESAGCPEVPSTENDQGLMRSASGADGSFVGSDATAIRHPSSLQNTETPPLSVWVRNAPLVNRKNWRKRADSF